MVDLRLFLLDDHQIFRHGLRLLLEREPGLSIVGEAGDTTTALDQIRAAKPDLVLVDVHLPGEDGITAAGRILALHRTVKIIFLSSDADTALVRRALDAGGSGYLLKENAPQDLLRAIQAAAKGGVYLSPELAAALLSDYRQREAAPPPDAPAPLSVRELEVLRLIAEGLRNKEIANQLKLSTKSVETCRSRLLKKLGYDSTAELVRHAIRQGLISA
ncbi:MAG: response regulator transcription factor [Lacunisphaera sp.]|nr:response regulator transcription factor [Lacunisphaera sp.]